MIRPIVHHPHPILSRKAGPFTFTGAEMDILGDLAETRKSHQAYGIAAPQIGEPTRAVHVKGIGIMINPEIVVATDIKEIAEESCLSFPWLKPVRVARPASGVVRWQKANEEWIEARYSGFTFRIIQHEIDHLDGITIEDHRRGRVK